MNTTTIAAEAKNSNLPSNTNPKSRTIRNKNPKPYAICKICGAPIYSPLRANNGLPAVKGYVCHDCNWETVIPLRLALDSVPGAKYDRPILRKTHRKDYIIDVWWSKSEPILRTHLMFDPTEMTDENIERFLVKNCEAPRAIRGWWIRKEGKTIRDKYYPELHTIDID